MRKATYLSGVVVAVLLVGAMALAAACEGQEQEAGQTPEGTPAEGDIRSRFPEDVQPLLADLPDEVVQALWNVRQAGPNTLVWKDSGGELFEGFKRAYLDEWSRITGWDVLNQSPVATVGDVRAQVESGAPEWDVIEIGSIGDALLMEEEGLLEPLDLDLMRHYIGQAPEGYRWSDYWVEYGKFGVLLIWNTDVYGGNPPQSALDAFNMEEFPGKRCFFNYPQFAGTLEYPLLAEGVPPDRLYPLDVERALAKLDTIRDDIVWWGSGAESVQFILDGQCDMGYTWQGRIALRLKDEPNLPLAATWKDVLLIDAGLGIPKGAPHYEAAMSALAYGFTAQNQCDFLNELGYGVPIDESCLNDFARTWAVTAENAAQAIAQQDPEYYKENIDQIVERFTAWLTE